MAIKKNRMTATCDVRASPEEEELELRAGLHHQPQAREGPRHYFTVFISEEGSDMTPKCFNLVLMGDHVFFYLIFY